MPRRLKRQHAEKQPEEVRRSVKSVVGKNKEQDTLIKVIRDNDIILLSGKAGSGKTYISAGMAAEYLLKGLCEKIVLSRPVVCAEEKFGTLPGDSDEKISPFLTPMLGELSNFIDIKRAVAEQQIVVLPIAFMRGHTLKNSFVMVDESENLTYVQLKMVLTRYGEGSKLILNGDTTQSDLDHRTAKDFEKVIEKIKKIAFPENRIAVFRLTKSVRHPHIETILNALGD